jgi:putative phosphoribosyl transferase
MFRFKDRKEAGQLLAQALQKYDHDENAIVIGLPRGGVVVACEIAKQLHLSLDVIVVRKIGAPGDPELAVGAIAEGGQLFLNQDIMMQLGLQQTDLQSMINKQLQEVNRRVKLFRGNRPAINLKGKTVIIVDDGVATGATVQASIEAVRAEGAEHIILALPVVPPEFRTAIGSSVDHYIVLQEESFFPGISYFYQQFDQIEDDEVVKLLQQS